MASQDSNSTSSGAAKVDYVFTRDFLDNNRCVVPPSNSKHAVLSRIQVSI